ncbi:hypothetical protein [Gordonia shandongensis]|uniref:hypothetical protein n=1 Tax=Gordonia shandongensis TaxID=376351 RepID=UPI00041322FA|nr:hypothetical protein [Gordonia shandongensis]
MTATGVLGLHGRGAAAVAGVAWAMFAVIGLTSGDVTVPVAYVAGLGVVGAGWALLLRAPDDPMPGGAAVAAAASGPVAGGVAAGSTAGQGHAALLALGAVPAVTMALIAVRGRLIIAWGGVAATVAAAVGVAAAVHAAGVRIATVLAPGMVGVCLMATVFALLIRPRAAQVAALRRRGERDASERAMPPARDAAIARLDAQARPLLEQLAAGRRLSDAQAAACVLLEAELRDRIRAPGLDDPAVAAAVRAARVRGVRVVLLDDRVRCEHAAVASAALDRVRAAALDAVVAAAAGTQVTIRLLPERHDDAATIVVTDGGGAQYTRVGR